MRNNERRLRGLFVFSAEHAEGISGMNVRTCGIVLVAALVAPALAITQQSRPGCVAQEQAIGAGSRVANPRAGVSAPSPAGEHEPAGANYDWKNFDKNDHTRAAEPGDYVASAGSQEHRQELPSSEICDLHPSRSGKAAGKPGRQQQT
jgi:hypothetical protein